MPHWFGSEIAGKASLSLVVGLTLLGAARSAPAADTPKQNAEVYGLGRVLQIHITLSAEEYAGIQPLHKGGVFGFGPKPKEPEKEADPSRELHRNHFGMDLPLGTGSITVGEEMFAKVGIRYKGNGTILDASRTIGKSFKIDLTKAGGARQFAGSKTINLHCGVTDPSKCRESLGYEIYRAAGVHASRTALAEIRLTVPGKFDKELLGIYTIVEPVDKPFLRDRFGEGDGLLMKPESLREFKDLGDDWNRYKRIYGGKRDATKDEAARMIAFARLVHKADDANFQKEIESYIDIEGYLRFLAATSFVSNSDSFFALGHNYYLYLHSKTKKLHFMPWDLDRAFANFFIFGSNDQQMDLSLTRPYSGTHRLTERILAVPGVGERYKKLLIELAGSAFEKERLLKQLAVVDNAVKEPRDRGAKAASARKESASGFGTPGRFGGPPALQVFFEKRTASLASQIAGMSKGHVPTGGFPFGGSPNRGN